MIDRMAGMPTGTVGLREAVESGELRLLFVLDGLEEAKAWVAG